MKALRRTFLTLLAIAGSCPAAADEWSKPDRAKFLDYCVGLCEPPGAKCSAFCACVVSETEKFMSPADVAAADAAEKSGQTTPLLPRFQAVFPSCSRQVFGPQ